MGNVIFALTILFFLSSCAHNHEDKQRGCSQGTTNVDGVCVSQDIANYVSCVRAQGTQLASNKKQLLSADLGKLVATARLASEIGEVLEKKYSVSDKLMYSIIEQCNKLSGINSSFDDDKIKKTEKISPIIASSNTKKVKRVSNVTKWNGLVFKIREAIKEGEDLTVKYVISNPGNDKVVKMLNERRSRVYINGEEYHSSNTLIGKSRGGGLYAGVTIPGGISVNSSATFKSISHDVTKIDMFRILFLGGNVSFRNVIVD